MLESMLATESKRSTGQDPNLKVVSLLNASVSGAKDLINPGYAIRTLTKQTSQGQTWFDGIRETNQVPYLTDIPNLDARKDCLLELVWCYDTFERTSRLIQFDFVGTYKSSLIFNEATLRCVQRSGSAVKNTYYKLPLKEYGIYHTALQQVGDDVHLFIDGKPVHVFLNAHVFRDTDNFFFQTGRAESIFGLLFKNLRVYQGIKYPPGEEFKPQYDFTVENS